MKKVIYVFVFLIISLLVISGCEQTVGRNVVKEVIPEKIDKMSLKFEVN